MKTLDELILDKRVLEEYKKTFLLNIFKKICIKMKSDSDYSIRINNIFKQSYNRIETIQVLVKREFLCELTEEQAELMDTWFVANQKKKLTRNRLSLELKKKLYANQQGKCAICEELLGNEWSKIHIDHIIPWTLVGDELENNYQDLCETCNECKSSRIDYMFNKILKLV